MLLTKSVILSCFKMRDTRELTYCLVKFYNEANSVVLNNSF